LLIGTAAEEMMGSQVRVQVAKNIQAESGALATKLTSINYWPAQNLAPLPGLEPGTCGLTAKFLSYFNRRNWLHAHVRHTVVQIERTSPSTEQGPQNEASRAVILAVWLTENCRSTVIFEWKCHEYDSATAPPLSRPCHHTCRMCRKSFGQRR
jgi:hypothetical protein